MPFLLKNPYAGFSGTRLLTPTPAYGSAEDPYSIERYTEVGPGWSAGETGDRYPRAEFAPYVTKQTGNWQDNYATTWALDFDALNAATDAKVAADRARYGSMEGWEDPSLQTVGNAPNYAGALAASVGMTPLQFHEWAVSKGAAWEDGSGGSWGQNTNPFVNQAIALDTLIADKNLYGNEGVMAWRSSLTDTLNSGGEEWVRQTSGNVGLLDILKGALFVAGAMSGFGAIGGESFAGALGIGGTASGTSGVTSAIGTAGDLIGKAIGTGARPSTGPLFELPTSASEVVGADTLAPTSSARAVQKRRGASSRAVAMRSPTRKRASGRASTILGDYLSEDYLG